MEDIPEWVLKIVQADNLYCNKCRKILKVDHIISIGIQESSIEPYCDKLCIGLSCPECKDMTIFELKEMSLVEFAFEILEKENESHKQKKPIKKGKKKDVLRELSGSKSDRDSLKNKVSKITKKEVNEVIRFLDNTKTHEDFLVAMGLSPEQIREYNYKKDEEE